MDAGTVGSVMTILVLLIFLGMVWWVYHRGNRQKFEDAGRLPFQEEDRDTGNRQIES